jgi:beta-lactamase class D OXA-10
MRRLCLPLSLALAAQGAMKTIADFLILVFFAGTALSDPISENLAWNKEFSSESVNGVFVLCKSSSSSCTTNNAARASTTYIPASTFKIPNAIIGLETGVIKDERQVFKWDGKPRAMKQWERDLTLRGAIQVSAVPVFQQIAREIGEVRMQKYLNSFSYGNANISGGIDKFWLEGQLRISAVNQVVFLNSLYLNNLPASKANQLIVKEALVTEATPEYLVHSKTGFSGVGTKSNPGVAWWVGWVEKGTEVYFFAFNMDIDNESKLPLRKSIPTKIMASEGVIIGG